ncbi:hypothetical protein [Halobacillus yeomjeoni]|uniref:Uncharacterized protein n=1 Tax=Halobacillus yeomjeoni TaxID=311194 RepID=A0A931HXY8_9BACI|nr:hypothetical protein [Halobacillus yeomjeoni]MBH0231488.1 hypothetical protein [Halobacillus yeomjeoni]
MKKDKNTFVQTSWSNRQSYSRTPSAKLDRSHHAVQTERGGDSERHDQKRKRSSKRSKNSSVSIVIPPAPVHSHHSYDSAAELVEEENTHAFEREGAAINNSSNKETLFQEILTMLEDPSSNRDIYDLGLHELESKNSNMESSSSFFSQEGEWNETDYLESSFDDAPEDLEGVAFLTDIASSFESTSMEKYDGIKDYFSIQEEWERDNIESSVETDDHRPTIYEEISSLLEDSSSKGNASKGLYEESSSSKYESIEFNEDWPSSVDLSTESYQDLSSSEDEPVKFNEESLEHSQDPDVHHSQKFPELLEEMFCSPESSPYQSCFLAEDKCEESIICDDKVKDELTHIIRLPILLSRVDVEIDVMESLGVDGLCEVTKIDWAPLFVQAKAMVPSSKVFFGGTFQVVIEYVKDHKEGSLHTIKIPVYWDKVLNVDWLTAPNIARSRQNEYTFKDSLEFHYESYQEYTHPILSHLNSSNLVWHGSVEEKERGIFLQGTARLKIDLLQEQYVRSSV